MAAATRWILYFASKRRTCKEQLALGAMAYESIAMRKAYRGSCIGLVGRNTTAGMPPASFASPSHICRFKGAASSSAVFVQVQGSPALAGCLLPRPANTVPGHMGELDRRFPISPLLLLAFFESGRPKRTRLNRHRREESQSRPVPRFRTSAANHPFYLRAARFCI